MGACKGGVWGPMPHGGLRAFHQKSTYPDAVNFDALRGTNLATFPPGIRPQRSLGCPLSGRGVPRSRLVDYEPFTRVNSPGHIYLLLLAWCKFGDVYPRNPAPTKPRLSTEWFLDLGRQILGYLERRKFKLSLRKAGLLNHLND